MKTLLLSLIICISTFIFANEKSIHQNSTTSTLKNADIAPTLCNTTFIGSLDSEDIHWKSFEFTVDKQRSALAILNWSGSANFNLFLYNPKGELIEMANGTNYPEVIRTDKLTPGVWKLGVKAKKGAANFTLNLDCGLNARNTEVITFTGAIDTNKTSWIKHEFTIKKARSIKAILSWRGSADLNLFFRNPADSTTASSRGADNPEIIEYLNPVDGTWKAAVKAKTGATSYTIHLIINKNWSNPTTKNFAAKPISNEVFWGAGINTENNSARLVEHEQQSGRSISIHRMFFKWHQRLDLIREVKEDHEAYRLPWVSIKPANNASWKEMATKNNYIQELETMIMELKKIEYPVWLTIHHEPENGDKRFSPTDDHGEAPDYILWSKKVRELIDKHEATNIAFAPIFSTYSWYTGRDMNTWWAPGIYDFIGVTHYSRNGTSLLTQNWLKIRRWSEEKNMDIAISKWGIIDENNNKGNLVNDWYNSALASESDGNGARIIGLCAYDSDQEINEPFFLKSSQFNVYVDKMKKPTTADIRAYLPTEKIEQSITDSKISQSLSLFPNPANATLQLNFRESTDYIIQFYNKVGRLVKTIRTNSDTKSINIDNLESGLFTIKTTNVSNGIVERQKLFVK